MSHHMANELYQIQTFTKQLFNNAKKRQTNRSFSIRKENHDTSTGYQSVQQSQAKTKSQSLQSSKEVIETLKPIDNNFKISLEEKLKKFAPKQKFSHQDVPSTAVRPLAEIVQEALQNKTVEGRLKTSHKKQIQSSRSSVTVPKMADYVQEYTKQQLLQLLPVNLKNREEINSKYLSNNQVFDINASAESVKQSIKDRRRIASQQRQSRSGLQHYQKAVPIQSEEFAVPRALRLPFNTEKDLIIEQQNQRDRSTELNQGIRIKINKEKKIVNHLSSNHENTNLLFYNFNQYNEPQQNVTCERIPTRGGLKSRKEYKDRNISTAEKNVPFTISRGGLNRNTFHNQSGNSTAADSIHIKEKIGDFSAEQIYGNEYEQIRQSLLQNDNSSGRSVSGTKVKTKIPNSKIRRGKTLGRIAKIKVKSVEDEILEEMSGGEEDLS